MKRRESRDSRTKNDGSIDHTNKIYNLTVKNSVDKVSPTLRDIRMMGMRMNDSNHSIIDMTTRCIFIYYKGTAL